MIPSFSVRRILSLSQTMRPLSDAELKARMQSLRPLPLKKALPEAFACIYEAFFRCMEIRIHPEQLEGAIAMAQGKIAQLQTGEGKTFTAVFPACLHALSGQSVCVATVNPYLASRDREWLRPVYEALGFRVGLIRAGQEAEEKREAYQSDIVYGTHSEFGFDYLRDNLVHDRSLTVQREPYFMLVDEADSILLDDAVTPLLLSGRGTAENKLIYQVDRLIPYLRSVTVQTLDEDNYNTLDETYDYIVLEKERAALLTSLGAKHAAQYFPRENFDTNLTLQHLLYQALQAYGTLEKDVDYVVTDGKLKIVDRNTGRIAVGRRFCDGLWQALQVKEQLPLNQESLTLAAISYQQFFHRFPHLCGMTGTAWEDRAEFESVYGLSVKRIPPHKKCIRVDFPDLFAPTQDALYALALSEIRTAQQAGRPCLAAVRSVEESERFGAYLQNSGIGCNILNARNPEEEAEIIRQAGIHGTVTVATAMAGRGTDIRPDEQALSVGGLYVLGLSHQNTRRGDRQLRGRSGRQGNPGNTRFFVCPEDELLTRFLPGDKPFSPENCLKRIQKAQLCAEANARNLRSVTGRLDSAVGCCRDHYYRSRKEILEGPLPERFHAKPQALCREIILSEMDSGWADFLSEANKLKQSCGSVSLTGHNAEENYAREIARIRDVVFSDMRTRIEQRIKLLKDETEKEDLQ